MPKLMSSSHLESDAEYSQTAESSVAASPSFKRMNLVMKREVKAELSVAGQYGRLWMLANMQINVNLEAFEMLIG